MTSGRLRLEVFETPDEGPRSFLTLDGEELEDSRLAAFEQGYRAGWDDAVAAQADESAGLRQAIAQSLRSLSLDLATARAQAAAAFRPLCEAMTAQLLPAIARASLPAQIAEALGPYAELALDAPIDLALHPDAVPHAEAALIDNGIELPVRIVPDAALGLGQAILRAGPSETRIDLDGAVDRIARLVAEYLDPRAAEHRHGR